MNISAKQIKKKFTYKNYMNWPDNERWEIIDGNAYNMSPVPSIKHQRIGWNIKEIFINKKNKLTGCIPFDAPTDVAFDEFNVVQPDIFIVCNKDIITEKNIQGAPELIIEIVSKSTAYNDTKIKKDLYERFGVKEYILIFPELEIVERYILKRGKYGAPERFNWDEILKFKMFDIEINLWEVFEKEKKSESDSEED